MWGDLEAEDGAAEAGAGAVVSAGGEAEDCLVLCEARAAPGGRGPAWPDGGDKGREQVDGAVDGAHDRPREPRRQQREQVPRPERRLPQPPRRLAPRRTQSQDVEKREEDRHCEVPPRRRHRPDGAEAEVVVLACHSTHLSLRPPVTREFREAIWSLLFCQVLSGLSACSAWWLVSREIGGARRAECSRRARFFKSCSTAASVCALAWQRRSRQSIRAF